MQVIEIEGVRVLPYGDTSGTRQYLHRSSASKVMRGLEIGAEYSMLVGSTQKFTFIKRDYDLYETEACYRYSSGETRFARYSFTHREFIGLVMRHGATIERLED